MFNAAIFDMDGLLIDSERPIMAAWIEAARTLDIELSQSHYLQVVGLATAARRGRGDRRVRDGGALLPARPKRGDARHVGEGGRAQVRHSDCTPF